ncbi:MAG: 50S ribosomal protein L9 [Opitutales bacterium]|nr:50S ribosomal protein L9 [Opitutales bacterium]
MATQEILLLQPVDNLGAEGETVSVRAGFARNYLLPRSLAVPMNQSNRRYIDSLNQRRAQRECDELAGAERTAAQLKKTSIAIAVKTGEGGKMFGSVTAPSIVDRLKEDGITITRKQLLLAAPIKDLGKHVVEIKLHSDLQVKLNIEVVSENPIEEDGE